MCQFGDAFKKLDEIKCVCQVQRPGANTIMDSAHGVAD